MDDCSIEIDVTLIGLLVDALGYCDEDSYEILLQLAEGKLKNISNSKHSRLPFLQACMPQVGMSSEAVDAKFNALIEQSANAGDPEAQYKLGCFHWERDQYKAAIRLYKSSADCGYPPSQYCLGLGLYSGEGIEKDEQEGLFLIELAAHRLYEYAIEFLIGYYENDNSAKGNEKTKLYSRMLEWSRLHIDAGQTRRAGAGD